MLSLPMNEFLQQSFKEIGIEIDFKVVELETLYTAWRKGAADEMNAGITSNNIAYVTSRPALRHRPLLPLRPDRAGRRQLGRLQESEGRRADRRGQADLRCRQAGRTAGAGACADRRRRHAGLGGARHQPARAVAEGEEVRAGAALVPGSDDDRAGVSSELVGWAKPAHIRGRASSIRHRLRIETCAVATRPAAFAATHGTRM